MLLMLVATRCMFYDRVCCICLFELHLFSIHMRDFMYMHVFNAHYQRRFDLIIPPFAFSRLCYEIMQNWVFRSNMAFGDDAIEALQTAAESFIVEKFEVHMHNLPPPPPYNLIQSAGSRQSQQPRD